MDYAPLCEAWPLEWCCEVGAESEPLTGTAALASSEYLWARSGRQFGTCSVLTRPCWRECFTGHFGAAPWWWSGQAWPRGGWGWYGFGVGCGCAAAVCSCSATPMVFLSAPVQAITEVMIDGTVLPAEAYALYDGFKLARIDGEKWPLCQDWGVPVSGTGAWSVTATYGTPVPALGTLANGQLTCQIVKACVPGSDCRLPSGLTSITRNGVTKAFLDPTKLAELGLTGLGLVDQFLTAVNPSGIDSPPQIWDPESYGQPLRPGGATR